MRGYFVRKGYCRKKFINDTSVYRTLDFKMYNLILVRAALNLLKCHIRPAGLVVVTADIKGQRVLHQPSAWFLIAPLIKNYFH
jgi:hypothetical protein